MNAILEWFKHTISIAGLSAPAWTFFAILGGVVVEYLLGRFAPTSCASLIALIATGLRVLLSPFARIPVVGPAIMRALEAIAGVDLDGDGHVGDPPAPPPPLKVAVLLAFVGLAATSCAHVDPIIHDVEVCAGPEVAKVEANLIPTVVSILECGGLDPSALPACAIQGLKGLAAVLGADGPRFVDCVVAAIEHDAAKSGVVKSRAFLYLARREAMGITIKAAP